MNVVAFDRGAFVAPGDVDPGDAIRVATEMQMSAIAVEHGFDDEVIVASKA